MSISRELGRLASGEVVIDPGSRLAANMCELVAEALPTIRAHGQRLILQTCDLGRTIGLAPCVRTGPHDEITYAYEYGSPGATRFVKGRDPEASSSLSVVLIRRGEEPGYRLAKAYIGAQVEPEPWEDCATEGSAAFWAQHAISWDPARVIPGIETPVCPWGSPARLLSPLGCLRTGEIVVAAPGRTFIRSIVRALPELLGTISAPLPVDVTMSHVFGRPIGDSRCVRTGPEDEIVYARQKPNGAGRGAWKRFVIDRSPEPSDRLTAVVGWHQPNASFVCRSAFIGPPLELEPRGHGASRRSRAFWAGHAWIWGTRQVVAGSETTECPW